MERVGEREPSIDSQKVSLGTSKEISLRIIRPKQKNLQSYVGQ